MPDYSMGRGWSLKQMVLEKLDIHMPRNIVGYLPDAMYKNIQKGLKIYIYKLNL